MASEFKMPELLPAAGSKPRGKSLENPKDSALISDPTLTESSLIITPTTGENLPPTPIQESIPIIHPPPKSKEALLAEKTAKYAEILSSLKYSAPQGQGIGATGPDARYSIEILKTGTIVDSFKFSRLDNKSFYVVGRVPGCDIVAENPTVSRTHAILQFISCPADKKNKGQKGQSNKGKDKSVVGVGYGAAGIPDKTGLYLYDLNSTHGTFINKNQIFPNRYYRLHVGHVLKFGNSTRLYVILGPSEDEEEESELTVTELQNERLNRELERKRLEELGLLSKGGSGGGIDDDGCAWGMGDDAEEESDLRENPFAINFEESESFDNPKKTLRGWFERESYDLVYDCREKAPGQFICRINLPVDGPGGVPVFAEVDVKGKKKEAVHQAALQACQILDKYGVLRVAQHESKGKRKERDWADQDYYSSDEDTFLDRTGSVEKKREKRMKMAGKIEETIETFESLTSKFNALQSEVDSLQSQITNAQNVNTGDDVDIDDYVKFLKTGATDVKKLKLKLRETKEELKKVNKLLNIAKPASLPINLLGDKKPQKVDDVPQELPLKPVDSDVTSTSGNKMQVKFSLNKSSSKVQSSELSHFNKDSDSVIDSASADSSINRPKAAGTLFGPRLPTKPLDELKPQTKSAIKTPLKPQEIAFTEESSDKEEDVDKSGDQNSEASDEEDDIHDPSTSSNQISIKSKKRRIRQKVKKETETTYDYDESDPKYSTWVPPSNQRGDGRTSLNEKLGY